MNYEEAWYSLAGEVHKSIAFAEAQLALEEQQKGNKTALYWVFRSRVLTLKGVRNSMMEREGR